MFLSNNYIERKKIIYLMKALYMRKKKKKKKKKRKEPLSFFNKGTRVISMKLRKIKRITLIHHLNKTQIFKLSEI